MSRVRGNSGSRTYAPRLNNKKDRKDRAGVSTQRSEYCMEIKKQGGCVVTTTFMRQS